MTIDPNLLNDHGTPLDERCAILINIMKNHGIGSLLWYVHGSGDSPDDSSFHWYDDPDTARLCADSHGMSTSQSSQKAGAAGLTENIMGEFMWEILDDQFGSGWYNNEGGYGYVWVCTGERPQVGAALWEYPEPEAVSSGCEAVFGAPIEPDKDGGGAAASS